jgi:SCP-2 sterol transfer family
VSEFLTPAWIAELDAAIRAPDALTTVDDQSFVVEQRVSDAPAGEACYHLVLDGAESRATDGAAPAPNLVILTDYATAVALLRGTTNAQHAIADGRMKVSGDLHAAARRIEALAGLDDVFAAVRATTTCSAAAADSTGS